MAGKRAIDLPYSRVKHAVADILAKEGYVNNVSRAGVAPKESLRVEIKYDNGTPVITGLKRVSKPGLRWYVNKKEIPTVVGGMGVAILSTPQGIMTGREAKKLGIGGELLCTIW